MARKRPSSDGEDVNRWLQTVNNVTGLPVRQVAPKHWQLGMRNRVSQYTMDIKDQGEWVSYGVPLTPDVEGRKQAPFYRGLLGLSGKLNGSHIGMEGDKVILTREDPKEGLDPLSFGRSIRMLDSAHEAAYPEVLKEAKRHGLRFKKK